MSDIDSIVEKAPAEHRPKQRLDWIDAVKGLTIIMVVFHHSVAGFRFDPLFPEWIRTLDYSFEPVRMPLFFLVAGLFAKKAIDGPAEAFIRGKVIYFLYFYLLWSLIIFAFRFGLNPITNSVTHWWEIFIILWDPLPTIWFLYALLLSFLIMRALRGVPPVYVVAFAAIIQAQYLAGVWIEGVIILDKLARLFVYFVIGVYASDWIRNTAILARPVPVLLCWVGFVSLIIFALFTGVEKMPIVFFSLSALSAAAVIGTIVLACKAGLANWLVFVGSYSLYIYLTHFLPIAGARILLSKIFDVTDPLVVIPLSIGAAVAFGIFFCKALTGTKKEWFIRVPDWISERRFRVQPQ